MNTYKSTCTHQQTVAGRKATVKILTTLPVKSFKFFMGSEQARKTHVISMVKKGFLDGWFCRILDGHVNFVPARDMPSMIDRSSWTAI